MSIPLLATKLYLPTVRAALVQRPRLSRRLRTALACPLTLISAPAGFGKTTLLAEWINDLRFTNYELRESLGDEHLFVKLAVAWLSLDEGDNDPVRFWLYLSAALEKVYTSVSGLVQTQLQAPQPPPMEAILTQLINALAEQKQSCTLVLDDYHLIQQQAIHNALVFLLDHLPPNLHLVLLTRSDPPLPLARWRVRGQLLELRTAELRFTTEEAAAFLQQTMGLLLTGEQVAQLEQRTEGWIAGLQLAALSMQERGDIAGFLNNFTGSNRYVLDYLIDEVLHLQSAEVQRFLIATAILERLSPALCDAVTERSDSRAILMQLERNNLFLIALDNERRWYRYHHLFADVLRSHLHREQRDNPIELHRRASHWYAANQLINEAITHGLAANDLEFVADQLVQNAETLLNRGEVTTLDKWLDRLPEALVRSHARLCLAHAHLLYHAHQLEATTDYVAAAEQAIQNQPELLNQAGIASEVAAFRVSIALYNRDLSGTVELARQALALMPADKLRMRARTTMQLGIAHNWRGELPAAGNAYAEAVRLARLAGDVYTAVQAMSNQAGLLVEQGHLRQGAVVEQHTIDLAVEMGAPQISTVALSYQALGDYHYEWNQLEIAERNVREAIARTRYENAPRVVVLNNVTLARILAAQGQITTARDYLQQAEELVKKHSLPDRYRMPLIQQQVQFWLAQDNQKAAADCLQSFGIQTDDAIKAGQEELYLVFAQLLLRQGQPEQTLPLLARLLQMDAEMGRHAHDIQIISLQSLAIANQGDKQAALVKLEQTLRRAEPNGYIRTFVDLGAAMHSLLVDLRHKLAPPSVAYLDHILAAFGKPQRDATPGLPLQKSAPAWLQTELVSTFTANNQNLIEPLSERELEVLRLVMAGASNQEIADQLIVAVNTVKRHVSNIMGKLAVENRTQATAKARKIGLI